MYLGPNNLARVARYRATVEPLSGIFSKIKKIVKKITPKELSPIRMLKDSAKKKATITALKHELEVTKADAASQVADAQIANQIAKIQSLAPTTAPTPGASFGVPAPTQAFQLTESAPVPYSSPMPQQFFAPTASASPTASAQAAPPEEDNTALYVGLGLLGLGAVYDVMGGKK